MAAAYGGQAATFLLRASTAVDSFLTRVFEASLLRGVHYVELYVTFFPILKVFQKRSDQV